MNDRITQLRIALNLSQTEFAEKIGISRSGYACLESKTRNVQERHVRLILAAFPQVSETWLRSGDGPMFEQNRTLIDDIMKKYSFPEIIHKLLIAYDDLEVDQQVAVYDYACRFIASIVGGLGSPDKSSVDQPADQPPAVPDPDPDQEPLPDDVAAELAAYQRELLAEKSGQTSSASENGNGSTRIA